MGPPPGTYALKAPLAAWNLGLPPALNGGFPGLIPFEKGLPVPRPFFDVRRDIQRLRNLYRPLAGVIVRCFEQGLTVAGCIWFIHATEGIPRNATPERLNSEECQEVVRELFWGNVAENPLAVIARSLGMDASRALDSRLVVRKIHEDKPHLLSWIPTNYRVLLSGSKFAEESD